jgi:hypothetical protein
VAGATPPLPEATHIMRLLPHSTPTAFITPRSETAHLATKNLAPCRASPWRGRLSRDKALATKNLALPSSRAATPRRGPTHHIAHLRALPSSRAATPRRGPTHHIAHLRALPSLRAATPRRGPTPPPPPRLSLVSRRLCVSYLSLILF